MLHQPCWFAIAVEKHIIVPVNFAILSSSSFLPTGCVWCVHLWNVCCVHTHNVDTYVNTYVMCTNLKYTHKLCVHCVVCIFIFSKMQEVPQTEEYYQQQHANSYKRQKKSQIRKREKKPDSFLKSKATKKIFTNNKLF